MDTKIGHSGDLHISDPTPRCPSVGELRQLRRLHRRVAPNAPQVLAVVAIAMSEHSSKILDLTYLAEAADGDAKFIKEILSDYLHEMAQYLAEMDGHLKKSDVQPLLRCAHTIKGASANVGAVRVRETAAKLEALTKRSVLDGSESLVALLHQEIARVQNLVEREGVPALLRAVS